MKPTEDNPIEVMRLSDRDRTELIKSVDQAGAKAIDEERRRLRVSYAHCKAVLTLFTENGSSTRFVVMPRNLSRLGVAFVHGRFVFPDGKCEIMLKSLDDRWHPVPGVIRSCRHIKGMAHEITVVFDHPIDLPAFAELTPEQEMLHLEDVYRELPPEEAARVKPVAQRVLVIDAFPVDRKLFSLWLSRSGFKSDASGDSIDALNKVGKTKYDMIVIEMRLGEENGIDLIKDITSHSPSTPVLAISADGSVELRQAALDAGAQAFLLKPFTEEQLIEQSQKLMGIDPAEDSDLVPIYSTSKSDEELKPLLAEFVRGLHGYMLRLREATSSKDQIALESLVRNLKGAGSGYGLVPVTESATAVLEQLDNDAAAIDEVKRHVNELIQVLNRVRL